MQSPLRRAALLLPAIIALMSSWSVVRWYVGNTIAEYEPGVQADELNLARLAVRWSPDDPFAHWVLGNVEEKEFSPGELAAAAREYETAVNLSPNDYRYWMELGRGLEASGDRSGAERALGRAVELAPFYSYPRWYLGNLLVREGKQDQAFDELERAAEANGQLWSDVFNLVWQVLDGKADAIANAVCHSARAKAEFTVYLVRLQKFDDAVRIWNSVNAGDRRGQRALGESLKSMLIGSHHFQAAANVMRDLAPGASNVPVTGQFLNGGFEAQIEQPAIAETFGWVISSVAQAQVAVDRVQRHSGQASLRITFKAPTKLDTVSFSQIVLVEPDAEYRFECYARTENLTSGAMPVIEILDSSTGGLLATSQPLPTGTNEWQPITVEFKTKPKTEAVQVRLRRASCGQDPVCPIFGTVWYDDFNLQRLGGPAAIRSDSVAGARAGNAARAH